MDRVINRGSHFFVEASTLLESESQPSADSFMNWCSNLLHSLQTTMDYIINWCSSILPSIQTAFNCVINWLVSLVSCLGAKMNPIVEKITGHKFNVKDNSCNEIGIDGEMLLRIAGAVAVAVVAIALVWLIWKMIMVIFRCCCCCCRRGRTMKAPGRNCRISRDNFERNPANYFRNLHKDQRNGLLV